VQRLSIADLREQNLRAARLPQLSAVAHSEHLQDAPLTIDLRHRSSRSLLHVGTPDTIASRDVDGATVRAPDRRFAATEARMLSSGNVDGASADVGDEDVAEAPLLLLFIG
jgi:hypothetical protein